MGALKKKFEKKENVVRKSLKIKTSRKAWT